MDGISRIRSAPRFEATTGAAPPEVDAGDRSDGPAGGLVSGDATTARAYDAINALDLRTADLGSHTELAVYGPGNRSAIAPAPISAAQGRHLAAAARRMLAEEAQIGTGKSPWSRNGTAICRNPEIASPRYAGGGAWKCNVFVGEAFARAGLHLPLTSAGHYATANSLATRAASFQPVTNLNHVRPGDLISINRRGESGHVEIVTAVDRDPAGHVRAITSLAAHEPGLAEDTTTAAPLVEAASKASGQIGPHGVTITERNKEETFHLLRPTTSPVTARDVIRANGPVRA
jgi:hypothetical protein